MRILKSGSFENLFKVSFPVRFDENMVGDAYRNEGIGILNDPDMAEQDMMPGVKNQKKNIRSIVDHVTLPRIVFPTPDHIIELDGQQYYLVDIAEPQPKKNPEGTIYLMNLQTGRPERKPFMPYADRINSIKKERIKQSVDDINKRIKSWNEKIEKITMVQNPTTWPLQLHWASEVVNDRINELTSQEQALMGRLDRATDISPSFSSIIEKTKQDLISGAITNPADIVDSVLFIYDEDPDSVTQVLNSPSIPAEIKTKIEQLIQMQTDAAAERASEREEENLARQERIEAPQDQEILQPGQMPLETVTEEDIETRVKKTKLPTPDQFFSLKGRTKAIRGSLANIRRDKTELTGIKSAIDGLRTFIASLAKGERAKDVLMNTERGAQIKQQVADFIHQAKAFKRRYASGAFVIDAESGTYHVNPKLFGTKGGKGNAEVAVAINQIESVVVSCLKAYATPNDPNEQEAVLQDAQSFSFLPQDLPS